MAAGYTTRKLQVFSLHAHQSGVAIEDYKDLFLSLHKIKAEQRIVEINNKVIAIPTLEIHDDTYVYFIAYEGEKDVFPIIFNTEEAKARVQDLVSSEVLVTKTHGIIDFIRREAIIEYNFRGAKAKDVTDVIQSCLSSIVKYSELDVELNPKADASFASAINKFERIKLASLKVAKSNPGWTDHANNLSQLADESDGQTINVEISAVKGKSLSTAQGIIKYIKEFALHPLSTIKNAKISGTRPGEKTQTTISLDNYIEHIKVNVKQTKTGGHVDDLDIKHKLQDYRRARATKKEKNA